MWAVSDIHTDYPQNLAWAQQWCAGGDFKQDAILLAGDVSDSLETLTKTLQTFAAAFGHVFFVPGNHGEWVGLGASCRVAQCLQMQHTSQTPAR